MAIPGWLWPPDDTPVDQRLDTAQLESATDVFALCSDSTRLEILVSLSTDGPLSYSQLRADTSVDDKGRFNYHLRQMSRLIERTDGSYTLSSEGKQLTEALLGDDSILEPK